MTNSLRVRKRRITLRIPDQAIFSHSLRHPVEYPLGLGCQGPRRRVVGEPGTGTGGSGDSAGRVEESELEPTPTVSLFAGQRGRRVCQCCVSCLESPHRRGSQIVAGNTDEADWRRCNGETYLDVSDNQSRDMVGCSA